MNRDDIVFDLYKYNPEEDPPVIVYKAIKEIKSLRQQLADSQNQVTLLREALVLAAHYADHGGHSGRNQIVWKRALAATEPKK